MIFQIELQIQEYILWFKLDERVTEDVFIFVYMYMYVYRHTQFQKSLWYSYDAIFITQILM